MADKLTSDDDLAAATNALRSWMQSQNISQQDAFLIHCFEVLNLLADKFGEPYADLIEPVFKFLIDTYRDDL